MDSITKVLEQDEEQAQLLGSQQTLHAGRLTRPRVVLGLIAVSVLSAVALASQKVLRVGHDIHGSGSRLHALQSKAASTAARCADLVLSGFDTTGCEALAPGNSCQVSCPEGKQGDAVRFWCFSKMAEAKAPPAGVSLPDCKASNAKPFKSEFIAPMAIDEGLGTLTCLDCSEAWTRCTVKELEDPQDTSSCSNLHFKPIDGVPNVFQFASTTFSGWCLDIFPDMKPGLWSCNQQQNQQFEIQEASRWTRAQICSLSPRGRVCFGKVGLPPLVAEEPTPRHLAPLLQAGLKSDGDSIVKAGLVLQQCRAMLESNVPNSFWSWLDKQGGSFKRSLFASYPVHPNQVNLLHDIVETVGQNDFKKQDMGAFAVSVSWLNRWKGIDDMVTYPAPWAEQNQANYLKDGIDEFREEMKKGLHTEIQSNECNDYNKCCGDWRSWKFKWPRDPQPSIKEWIKWWGKVVKDNKEELWTNPLGDLPWTFASFLWPSPLPECEWVHRKLIDKEAMEGGWYEYNSSFHKNVCKGGKYHPDSIPGMATYGGVCGRMSLLEARKNSCMGVPATQKTEPGHAAGFRFLSQKGVWGILEVPGEGGKCLVCNKDWSACSTSSLQCSDGEPVGEQCTTFMIDLQSGRIKPNGLMGCLDIYWGPRFGVWTCDGDSRGNQAVWMTDDVIKVGKTSRGTLDLRLSCGAKLHQQRRHAVEGFHEIQCTKSNCHFHGPLGVLNPSQSEVHSFQHKEAALALAEAYNSHEKHELWPTAYDEARLAASVAATLPNGEEASALITWALHRNPAVYEAWEVAAKLQVHEDALRDGTEAHAFFKGLDDRRLQEASSGVAAEDFAQRYLLSPNFKAHWQRFPVLRKTITHHLCQHLSEPVLRSVGQAAHHCLRTRGLMAEEEQEEIASVELLQFLGQLRRGRSLAQAKVPAWINKMLVSLRASDVASPDGSNAPPAKFSEYLQEEVEPHLLRASSENRHIAMELLLSKLSVGFVDDESTAFYEKHKRLLIRGPYVMVLQLASKTLDCSEREALMKKVVAKLTQPNLFDGNTVASTNDTHVLEAMTGHARRLDDDKSRRINPPHDVMQKMQQERSLLIELGPDMPYQDIMSIPLEKRFDAEWLVRKHLQLNLCGSGKLVRDAKREEQPKRRRKLSAQARRLKASQGGSPSRDELIDMCVSDLLRRDIDWSAGPPIDPCWTRHEHSTIGKATVTAYSLSVAEAQSRCAEVATCIAVSCRYSDQKCRLQHRSSSPRRRRKSNRRRSKGSRRRRRRRRRRRTPTRHRHKDRRLLAVKKNSESTYTFTKNSLPECQ
eukprot:TRINITY_DN18465_c0_g1_i1.p1 TRINITY_DN18465_c0_g1~~TRINITY_DN18465_c0_g1_i1.p1  ORF type:complete len:1302 (+),score=226.36 TRINITY_DN18465_c0_g1_i1:64-3969(+)